MAGVCDSRHHNGNCPCNTPPGSTQQVQSFVGSHYFCESGKGILTIPGPTTHCTQWIHYYGMDKIVVLMKLFVVQLQVFHGFTETNYK